MTPAPATSRASVRSRTSWAALPIAYGAIFAGGSDATGGDDRQHAAPAALDHPGDHGLRQVQRGPQVLVQHPGDIGRVEVRDRGARGIATDEVDQHVDAPECGASTASTAACAPSRCRTSPTAATQRSSAEAEISRHGLESIAVRADQAKTSALRGEDARRLAPEDAGRAGDQDDAVGVPHCVVSVPRRELTGRPRMGRRSSTSRRRGCWH